MKELEKIQETIDKLKEKNVKLLFDKDTLIKFCNKLTKIIDEKKKMKIKYCKYFLK